MHGWTARELIGPVLAGLALLGLTPAGAHVCKPLAPAQIQVERPRWPDEAQIELVDEQIEIECESPSEPLRCRWRALYVYQGSAGAAADGQLRLPNDGRVEHPRVHLNGRPVAVEHRVAPLQVADASHVEVEVEFEVAVQTRSGDTCTWAAGYARHLVVGRMAREAVFVVPEGEPLQRLGRSQLRALAPSGWRVLVDDGIDSRSRELEASLTARKLHRITLANRPLAHEPFVGLLGTVDVYQRPGRAAVRGALLLQVSI